MADRLSADWPTFATLPAGRFAMGTAEQHLSTLARHYGGTRESYREETPQHDVTVAHCAIATTPVTVGWYARFVADTGTAAPAGWSGGMPPAGRELHPVVDVTWHDARAFCAWLTPQLAAAPAWHNWHARLPTEAEWEYAARGTDGRQFPWGDAWQPDAANTRECGLALTTPVIPKTADFIRCVPTATGPMIMVCIAWPVTWPSGPLPSITKDATTFSTI